MSVFTYDTQPARVSSPWLLPTEPQNGSDQGVSHSASAAHEKSQALSDYGVTKLEAEPQEGPVEYKLHLLLRPRRQYETISTASRARGSHRTHEIMELAGSRPPKTTTGVMAISNQSRQDRLVKLTTQLLWRLQQSSPYHAKSTNESVTPKLPSDDADLSTPPQPGRLVPGLEQSRGALYEIGVADDGTLVGLTKDEMDESIHNLRIMASSLGCLVEVLRMVAVGHCEWTEPSWTMDPGAADTNHTAKLWVAEALVVPDLASRTENGRQVGSVELPRRTHSASSQLRVTLTGPTTSGKSTLLGTLLSGSLDNGNGRIRMNLLKHQHELESGVTSSVAHELIGYKDGEIVNYSHSNVESWDNIHDFTEDGRLVFLSDSAGHPRFRRTIVRGLIGWSPQWTLLCVAADDAPSVSSCQDNSPNGNKLDPVSTAGGSLAQPWLTLCLKLKVPLAVIMTKFDMATKAGLQRTLGQILSVVKGFGRTPKLVHTGESGHGPLDHIPEQDDRYISAVLESMSKSGNLLETVPIILTSAVRGTGVGAVHALLQHLPLPPPPTSHDLIGPALNPEQPRCLFHVEDKFSLPATLASLATGGGREADAGTVVAGYLRFGKLSVGDKVLLGPFPSDEDDWKGLAPDDRPSLTSYGLSVSHTSSSELSRLAMKQAVSASAVKGEWHEACIVSIRNLRLSVQVLEAGEAGTIGVVINLPDSESVKLRDNPRSIISKVRRGMVLAVPSKHMIDTGLSLQAASGLTASFEDVDVNAIAIGGLVNIYIASVRAAAKVISIRRSSPIPDPSGIATDDIDEVFSLNEDDEFSARQDGGLIMKSNFEVHLELYNNREWIELGSQILILDGGGKEKWTLEGWVGKVVEIVE